MIADIRPSTIVMGLRRVLRNDPLLIGLLAVLVGLLVGGAVVGFRELIALAQALFYGTPGERLYRHAAELPWWRLAMAPVAGGLLVALQFRLLFKRNRPSGVAQVIEAAATRNGKMSLCAGLGAAVITATAIGAGASVGREGPAVHLGGSIAGWFAGKLRLGANLARVFLGCGVASAVAASFNAPIAGALFANEVVVGSFVLSAFAPVVLASVTATMVSRAWFGDVAAFAVPPLDHLSWGELPVFAALGTASAVVAFVFMRAVAATEANVRRLPLPAWARPAAAGVVVGVIAIAYPQVLGVGYEISDDVLKGTVPLALMLALLLAKLVATSVSLGMGFPGGIFGPSLVLGGLLGGIFGSVTELVFPGLGPTTGAYALVGMGAVASAVLGGPISTTLIMFELTGDYQVTVAVMVASVISSVVSANLLDAPSFFAWQLADKRPSAQQEQ